MVVVEVGAGSFRRDHFDANMVNHRLHMDLIEELTQKVQVCLAAYQQMMKRYFNGKVKF